MRVIIAGLPRHNLSAGRHRQGAQGRHGEGREETVPGKEEKKGNDKDMQVASVRSLPSAPFHIRR